MRRLRLPASALTAALLLAGCAGWWHDLGAAAVVEPATHPGGPVRLRAGGRLVVRLAANPSTGYRWTASSSSPATVASAGPSAYQGSLLPRPGAGGAEAFTFRALAPGAAHLSFEWRREPGGPGQAFQLDVVVEP